MLGPRRVAEATSPGLAFPQQAAAPVRFVLALGAGLTGDHDRGAAGPIAKLARHCWQTISAVAKMASAGKYVKWQVARSGVEPGSGGLGWSLDSGAGGARSQGAPSRRAWRTWPLSIPVLMTPFTTIFSSVCGTRERVKTTIVSRPWNR
jgi:hypothetical protein